MCPKVTIDEEKRWQTVSYHKLNYSQRRIARLVKVSTSCVKTTLKNYKKTGNIKTSPGAGRPKVTTPKDDMKLFNLSRRSPNASLRELSQNWKRIDGSPKASMSTVSRRLLNFGLSSYQAIENPLLKDVDRQNRYNWCQERKYWSHEKWYTIIFSVESNFELVNRKN